MVRGSLSFLCFVNLAYAKQDVDEDGVSLLSVRNSVIKTQDVEPKNVWDVADFGKKFKDKYNGYWKYEDNFRLGLPEIWWRVRWWDELRADHPPTSCTQPKVGFNPVHNIASNASKWTTEDSASKCEAKCANARGEIACHNVTYEGYGTWEQCGERFVLQPCIWTWFEPNMGDWANRCVLWGLDTARSNGRSTSQSWPHQDGTHSGMCDESYRLKKGQLCPYDEQVPGSHRICLDGDQMSATKRQCENWKNPSGENLGRCRAAIQALNLPIESEETSIVNFEEGNNLQKPMGCSYDEAQKKLVFVEGSADLYDEWKKIRALVKGTNYTDTDKVLAKGRANPTLQPICRSGWYLKYPGHIE